MTSPDKSLLDRFPEDVRVAYKRIQEDRDFSGITTVVFAAVRDFLPSKPLLDDQEQPEIRFSDEQRLIEDLGFDSLAIAELVFFLEDLFSVSISNEELFTVRTLGDLRSFVDKKLNETTTPKPE